MSSDQASMKDAKRYQHDADVEIVPSLQELYPPPSDQDSNHVELPIGKRDGNIFERMLYWETLLDAKLGIESAAIQRITPEEQTGSLRQLMAMSVFWASCTMNLACFSTGFIGPSMGLNLGRSLGITIAATVVGSLPVAWCATFGPESGLRQVSVARFSGLWFSRIVALLNTISNGGWCVVSLINGGQALAAAVGHSLSVAAGCVILACVTFVFAVFGIRGVYTYAWFSWPVMFCVFLAMYCQHESKAVLGPSTVLGLQLQGSSLLLFSIVYGSSVVSWVSLASDYFAPFPKRTSKKLVFALNVFGITVPTAFGMCAGIIYGNIMPRIQAWQDGYNGKFGLGGLLLASLTPLPWAKFALSMGLLSSMGVLVISVYSVSISIQQFARPLQYIPRIAWCVAILVVTSILAIAGRNALLEVLQSFLGILGYWSSIFVAITLCEHFFFRRGSYKAYDWTAWNNPSRLPIGLAAVFGFACGWGGAVVGMSETWYNGPISLKFGSSGGDVGEFLSFAFAMVGFIPARYLELRYIGR